MKVAEILRERGNHVVTVSADRTLPEAIRTLVDRNIGSLLVTDADGRVAGLITERDILREFDRRAGAIDGVRVAEVMKENPPTATPDDDLVQLRATMTERRVRHLPIVRGEELVGLVSLGDLVKVLHQAAEVENRHLKDYISGKYLEG